MWEEPLLPIESAPCSIMTQVLTMRPAPRAALHDILADVARTALRWLLLAIGGALVIIGVLMAPLPGPLGLPVTLIGLIIVFRNSFAAKRAFIRFQHRYPRFIFPLRRLLRRDPAVVAIAYQQVLRIEKVILPREWRRAADLRRQYFRRARR